MHGETVLFVKYRSDESPKAPLLFVADPDSVRVQFVGRSDSTRKARTSCGTPAAGRSRCLQGSRIVFKSPADLRRPAGSQPYALTHRDGQGEILFGGGHEYQDMQTVVTYTHEEKWPGATPMLAREQLPRTLQRLAEKKTLKNRAAGRQYLDRLQCVRLGQGASVPAALPGSVGQEPGSGLRREKCRSTILRWVVPIRRGDWPTLAR